MKISENWLREMVDPGVDRAQLCHRLTMAGLEVEDVTALGAGLDAVVVGEIVSCEPHPNADKLKVCQVDAGKGAPLQIVCGAPNARVGLKAPLALEGATLPNGTQIKRAALRGVESAGMLCSARELGLDADASGLFELPHDAPTGESLATYLALPDATIELKMTPNRPDCLGLRGLAYDVAALFGAPLRVPPVAPVAVTSTRRRDVRIDVGADCPRYLGRVIEGVDATARTPLWMTERLRRCGVRSVSAVVDVTNYVMFELGNPLHAFDDGKIDGAIRVRHATEREPLKLLDGSDVTLDGGFVVIADDARALALGGVMGGFESRVTDSSTSIFLESAHFAPAAIMGRARKLGMHTEGSHRFERGVDPELPRVAIERATQLLLDIVGGRAGPITEAVDAANLPRRDAVTLRRARLARVLGMHIDDDEVRRIFVDLGMQVALVPDGWSVTPPSRRFDIEIEEDLIEEVVRVHGYDRVPVRAPSGELRITPPAEAIVPAARVRQRLVDRGYHEAVCYSFVGDELLRRWSIADGAVALANPLSADLAVMRPSLLPGLVEALRHNLHRQQDRIRLFEIGRAFAAGTGRDGPVETTRMAGVVCGTAQSESWANPKRAVDYYDVKADLEAVLALAALPGEVTFDAVDTPILHPGRSAQVIRQGRAIGSIGSLHPRLLKKLDLDVDVYAFELDFDAVTAGRLPHAAELSKFPLVRRDIAVLLPLETTWAAAEAAVRGALGPRLSELILFDQYAGAGLGTGVKSLAIGLILQDSYRTLTDQDADHYVASAVTALERECSGKLRG